MPRWLTLLPLLLIAPAIQAAPVSLAWDPCQAPTCQSYRLYQDLGCLGHWTYMRALPSAMAIVTSSPGVTCWTVTAVDTQGGESAQATPIRIVVSPLAETTGGNMGYVVTWERK